MVVSEQNLLTGMKLCRMVCADPGSQRIGILFANYFPRFHSREKAVPAVSDYSILIADDDPGCRESLHAIVAPAGYPTYLAEDGEEALDLLEKHSVHLLLCDMYMRTMTGLETVTLARRINALLPCILVTASSDEQLMRKALEVKIYSVVNKPVSRHELLFTVQRALRRAYSEPTPSP